ncbi:MAG TPA: MerR family transcriptional regulator, partial [Acidobacteria bacterium]|nr:MerR family transcriptional regulator [Acidobacteriota bacterium]
MTEHHDGMTLLRIGEVARMVGVSPSTLRNWEREGLVQPSRVQGRNRYYTPEQVEQLRRIHRLRTVEGLNVNGVRRVLGPAI